MLRASPQPWVPGQAPPCQGKWRRTSRQARCDLRPPPAGGSSSGGSGAGGGGRAPPAADQQQRPRIPPLPYWCGGVAVVGLPDGQTAFSFLTDSEASAARRSQLRPEARFGGAALKLAVLPADKAAAILDRWQAAATLRQTADIDARPLLWQSYASAHKGATVRTLRQRRQAGKAAKAPAVGAAAGQPAAEAAHKPAPDSARTSSSGSGSGEGQPSIDPAPTPGWRFLAPALAACTAVGTLLRRAAAGVWAWPLAAYRRLPVGVRRLFWRTWPPEWPGHASRNLAALIASASQGDKFSVQALAAAGFDAQGQTATPLADLEAWQVERLTLTRVRDMRLYRAAFTHTSALPEHLRVPQSYERLEWLGDAVLSLAVRHVLMGREAANEGELTELESMLVSGASNARSAAFLGLDQYILCHPRSTLLAADSKVPGDVLESLLGALYLDAGFPAVQAFVGRLLRASQDWAQVWQAADHKSQLARLAAARGSRGRPSYQAKAELRPYRAGHQMKLRWWRAQVVLDGKKLGRAGGWSRLAAEQGAARQALEALCEPPPQPAT